MRFLDTGRNRIFSHAFFVSVMTLFAFGVLLCFVKQINQKKKQKLY